jgi:uncharacterized protein (DUF486 family)
VGQERVLQNRNQWLDGRVERVHSTLFYVKAMKQPLKTDYLWAGLCLVGAAFFMFRSGLHKP